MNRYLQAYRTNEVSTASRMKLVIMMYDGIIRFLRECGKRIDAGDIAGRGLYISKAQRILTELQGALNKEKGGEIAMGLERIYLYLLNQLTKANISGDKSLVENSIDLLSNLRDSWSQVMAKETGMPREEEKQNGHVAVQF